MWTLDQIKNNTFNNIFYILVKEMSCSSSYEYVIKTALMILLIFNPIIPV